MDDYREIENLIHRYTLLFDRGEWDEFSAMFADADWVMPAETHDEASMRGSAEVLSWAQANIRRYEDGTPKTNHVMSNVLIEVDGDSASASSYLTVFQNVPADPPGPLQTIFCGRYYDSFVKTDGRWRFARREILATSLGDLSAHVVGF